MFAASALRAFRSGEGTELAEVGSLIEAQALTAMYSVGIVARGMIEKK